MRLSDNGKNPMFETFHSPEISRLLGRRSDTSKILKRSTASTTVSKEQPLTRVELEMLKQQKDLECLKMALTCFMKEMRFSNDPYFREFSRMRTFEDPEREIFERSMEPVTLMSDSLFTDFSIDKRAIPENIQGSCLESLCEKHNLILREVLSALSILNEVRDEIKEECLKQYDWLHEAISENTDNASDNISLIKRLAITKKDSQK